MCMCLCLKQDILENESINLDWMFRYSLINDIVKVCAGPGWKLDPEAEKKCLFVWIFYELKKKFYLKTVGKVTRFIYCFVCLR